MKPTRRGILYVFAGFVAIGPLLVWSLSRMPVATAGRALVLPLAFTGVTSPIRMELLPIPARSSDRAALALARQDPQALAQLGQERYEREVQDYRCMLVKQERVRGALSPIEQVEVRFRKSPLAIYMLWRENAGEARRALFKQDDPAYVDDKGNQLARVEPAGAIARLFVKDIFMPIRGERARKASRRAIDECGFGATFELLRRFNAIARENDVLDMRLAGTGEVDGRPTYVIVRYLPYDGEGGAYPDAKMILHLDQEWLLPVAVESYADQEGTELLGRYVFTHVERNPGLTEDDFRF